MSTPEPIILASQRVIAFRPELARLLGSNEAAIYLQQLLHWQPFATREDGFFYKSMVELEEETMLTPKQQRLCRTKLETLGWIEVKKEKANGAPTLHFRVKVQIMTTVSQVSDLAQKTNGIVQKDKSLIGTRDDSTKEKYTSETLQNIRRMFFLYVLHFKVDPRDLANVTDPEERRSLIQAAANRYKLTDSRKAAIAARLKDAGYEMCKKAIINAAKEPWNLGENDRGWKADLKDYLFRNYEMIERWANK